jgi:hypothetical protein
MLPAESFRQHAFDGAADELVLCVAEHALDLRIRERDRPIRGDDDRWVGCRIEEAAREIA